MVRYSIKARGRGGRTVVIIRCRPSHGLMISVCCYPGVSLAKPRFTPGFMLSPASQAFSEMTLPSIFCKLK